MRVACPTCARVMTVPPDKLAIPRLKGRCPCGTEFAVTGPAAVAAPASIPHLPPPPPAPPVVPVPRATVAPAPARVPRAAPVPAPVVATAPPPDAAVRIPTRPVPWPRCANHPQVRSSSVCPRCVKGYCDACVQKVQGGAICATCDGLCVATAQYGQKQETAEQRDRSMAQDVRLIVGYPFRDPLAFVLLALFTWFFRYTAGFLAQGVLMLYTFHALTRVSNGDLKSTTPDFTDVYDLMLPARLAIAAFVISAGPLVLVTFFVPGAHQLMFRTAGPAADVVHAAGQPAPSAEDQDPTTEESPALEDDDEEDDDQASAAIHDKDGADRARRRRRYDEERGPGGLAVSLIALTLLWNLAYTPVALTVAALSRSYLSTLNPVIGIGTIARMGATYWHAMAIYTVFTLAQWTLGFGLEKIPVAGALVRSFTDVYASLAIACTLGLAVFKKAAELGWD